ncbi:hypothetical protein ACUULL_003252 [Vibrio cholerae]|uniref:hypothetical protein n=1 Tax=Gammaproteobacteria TaxID=1236 RepID=UPI001E62AC34|nr:hypothetical protein [Vibrio cholerae]EGR0659846.1 hypothetical protein [Vibrio cholerae]EGR0939079.1 hypothetical protein [Vibrio cholerae]EJL6636810.1 hypothetical protein [Vibrio cholerae]MCD1245850.1 hypothetical protein [Vibrio cholerae]HDI3293396.1 hypothetical protein [Vibrio cholerae]
MFEVKENQSKLVSQILESATHGPLCVDHFTTTLSSFKVSAHHVRFVFEQLVASGLLLCASDGRYVTTRNGELVLAHVNTIYSV